MIGATYLALCGTLCWTHLIPLHPETPKPHGICSTFECFKLADPGTVKLMGPV